MPAWSLSEQRMQVSYLEKHFLVDSQIETNGMFYIFWKFRNSNFKNNVT